MTKYILLLVVLLSCREKKVIESHQKMLYVTYGSENDTIEHYGDTLIFIKTPIHDTLYIHDTIYRTKKFVK